MLKSPDNNNSIALLLLRMMVLGFAFLFFNQCSLTEDSPSLNNPLNPDDPSFIDPETFITGGPSEGAVLDTHTVTLSWTGNDDVVEYTYRLNESGWSNWSSDTSITFTYLDEDVYVFEVKGRYHETVEDDTPETRTFEIDDIHGPALMFGPRKVTKKKNNSFTVDLLAEEVTNLMAVYAEIEYDTLFLRFDSYQVLNSDADFLRKNNGSVVDIVEEDAITRALQINLSVATGDPPGVDGTGALIRLQFIPLKTGTTEVSLSTGCTMIDSNLDEIDISELVDGVVEVE